MIGSLGRRILAIGHRGAKAIAKDNTIDSFHKALSHGVDMIEFDINLTQDDVLVVFHDEHLSDGRQIRDITYQQFIESDPDHISLASMLSDEALVESGVLLYFDLKNSVVSRPLMSYLKQLVVDGVWKTNRLWIASFDLAQATEIKNIRDQDETFLGVTVGAIFEDPLQAPEVYHAMGLQFLSIKHTLSTEAFIKDSHDLNMLVFSWTTNTEEVCSRLVAEGIDGLCGDIPDLIMKYRKSV